jgi:hypothetical protein
MIIRPLSIFSAIISCRYSVDNEPQLTNRTAVHFFFVEIFFSVTANQINLGSFFLPAGLVGGYIKTGSLFY